LESSYVSAASQAVVNTLLYLLQKISATANKIIY